MKHKIDKDRGNVKLTEREENESRDVKLVTNESSHETRLCQKRLVCMDIRIYICIYVYTYIYTYSEISHTDECESCHTHEGVLNVCMSHE